MDKEKLARMKELEETIMSSEKPIREKKLLKELQTLRDEKSSEPKQEVIKIDYPGAIISVNHYKYGGGRYTKKETKIWMDELGWLVKHLHIEDWQLPLSITCDGYFKDERSAPDLSNLAKVVCDAIAEVADGVNDKDFRWHDGKRVIGERDPYLLITIRESDTKLLPERTKSKSRARKVKR